MSRIGTAVLWGISVLLLICAVLLIRAESSWRQALERRDSGNTTGAIRSARAVFDFYVPGNPRLEDASNLIWRAAETQEAEGDAVSALGTYRRLRSAWISAHPLEGDGGWIARLEPRIARLASETVPETPALAARSRQEREAVALARMKTSRSPGAWGTVAALGYAGWLLAAIGLISLGFRKDGKVLSPAFGWTLFLGVGYVVWIVGLIRA